LTRISSRAIPHWEYGRRSTENKKPEETPMLTSRRRLLTGAGASISALAFLRALPGGAADSFRPGLLPSADEIWSDVIFVNNTMGPTRLTGSPQHQAYVRYLKQQLRKILRSAGGDVFEDTFENYPRWTAKSWELSVNSRQLPVSSYFPYCTGGFTGARTPLVPAPSLAASGSGGNYPAADGINAVIIPPTSSTTGKVVNLGTFTGTGSVDWTNATGLIAYIDVSVEAASNVIPPSLYTVNTTYDIGTFGTEMFLNPPNPTATIFLPPDITNATKAGVLGVILGWQGISTGNANGQYNPFTVPYSSSPPSSQTGSDPSQTKGGIPALWVTEDVGTFIKNNIVGQDVPVTLSLNAEIKQVSTSTVWGLLPGANYGTSNDQFLICNTHSDGPNIAEENGGIGVFNVAQYFARVPLNQRPKSMVFMASTGHFGHGFLGSGRDWITQHPQIVAQAVGCMTIEHFGCSEWEDLLSGSRLFFSPTGKLVQTQVFVTDPVFQGRTPGPADPTLLDIFNASVAGAYDRAAVLSGGVFLGEGGGFHAIGVPTIGYLPVPQYLCAMAADGEISKLDSTHFYSQVVVTVKCLLAMQQATADQLKGAVASQ
jgi:hypothetical protein